MMLSHSWKCSHAQMQGRVCHLATPHPQRCTRLIARVIIDPSGLAKSNIPGFRKVSSLEELQEKEPERLKDNEAQQDLVPASELPKPHPKAQKTLSKSLNKGGAYKGLVDVLASVSFTFASDDTELAWAIAQVRKDIRAGVKAVPCYIDTELNATARHGSKLRPGSSQRAGLGSTACVGSITQEFGKRVGWFPVSTARVLAGMHKVTGASPAAQGTGGAGGSLPDRAALLQALGSEEALAKAEAGVLAGIRTQKRVIVCTLPSGALAQPDAWRDVWGSLIVWIDEEDKSSPKARTPERQLLSQRAEAVVRLKKSRGFVGGGQSVEDKARGAIDSLVKELVKYLNKYPDVIDRKVQYVEYGCRGDWPLVQPKEWNPLLDGLQRRPVPGAEESSQQTQPDVQQQQS